MMLRWKYFTEAPLILEENIEDVFIFGGADSSSDIEQLMHSAFEGIKTMYSPEATET